MEKILLVEDEEGLILTLTDRLVSEGSTCLGREGRSIPVSIWHSPKVLICFCSM